MSRDMPQRMPGFANQEQDTGTKLSTVLIAMSYIFTGGVAQKKVSRLGWTRVYFRWQVFPNISQKRKAEGGILLLIINKYPPAYAETSFLPAGGLLPILHTFQPSTFPSFGISSKLPCRYIPQVRRNHTQVRKNHTQVWSLQCAPDSTDIPQESVIPEMDKTPIVQHV